MKPDRGLTIGFELTPFIADRRGGVLYYCLNLLSALSEIDTCDITVFVRRDLERDLNDSAWYESVNVIRVDKAVDICASQSCFDVMFNPSCRSAVQPIDAPIVTFVPDLQHLYYPQFFPKAYLEDRICHYPRIVNASTLVITPSAYSKRTVVEHLKTQPDKIRVIPHGVHPTFFQGDGNEALSRHRGDLLAGFLLYPANSWIHKNHRTLLDALLLLKRHHDTEVQVVFTGQLLHGYANHSDIVTETQLRGLQHQAIHLGAVPLPMLKHLYQTASALIVPSLFEGFGLPLAEAMSCGCPIIAARSTSIPEVAGEAALYFDPNDPSDIVDKIVQLRIGIEDVKRRVHIGTHAAKQYATPKMERAHLAVFEEAYYSWKRRETGSFHRASPQRTHGMAANRFVGQSK